MIIGWVVKIFLSIAALGVVGFEIGSPLVTRAQVDDAAHAAADEAAAEMFNTKDAEKARAVAEEVVAKKVGMRLDRFAVSETGVVQVIVSKEAASLVLERFEPTRDWYQIDVSAESSRPTR